MASSDRMGAPDWGRFLKYVVKQEDGCWLWVGARRRNEKGREYGAFWVNGGTRRAHIVAYVWTYDEPNHDIHHICTNPLCVNPEHLEVASAGQPRHRNPTPGFCARGHEFTDENTYINPRGERQCRTCMRAAVDRYQDANRDAYLRRRRERREPVVHAERECAHPECSERFVPIRATGVFCKTPECVRRRVRERRGLS